MVPWIQGIGHWHTAGYMVPRIQGIFKPNLDAIFEKVNYASTIWPNTKHVKSVLVVDWFCLFI
jgi:hypothetical protein